MTIEDFRQLVNSTIKSLQNQKFSVEECTKLSDNVTQLVVKKRESEIVMRQCIFWIEIPCRRCFIKSFSKRLMTDQQPRLIENEDIMMNRSNQMVQRKQVTYNPRFVDYGQFEIQQLGTFFDENGLIDQMMKQYC